MQPRAHARSGVRRVAAAGFSITDIPAIMDRKGWTGGARLMRRWFAGAAFKMPDDMKEGRVDPRSLTPAQLDLGTIQTGAILRFDRVKAVHDELITVFANPAARREMLTKLRLWAAERKIMPGATFRFGDLGQPANVVDATCQTNLRPVGGVRDPYDDFYAAIGRASLKVAVTAQVRMTGPGSFDVLRLDQIGVYLRDTYDFNGDQFLGYWTEDGVSTYNIFGNRVDNGSFEEWRRANRRGGDFVVYSNVLRLNVTPQRFSLPG